MSAHRTALPARVERRNAVFQHWESLLTNRTQRTRSRELIVQGVRPITQALEHGVPVTALLSDGRDRRSRWAQDVLDQHGGPVVRVAPELLAELGEREDGAPELLALVELPADDLSRIPRDGAPVVVVFDRPAGPGNIGSLARSVDALGGSGLVTTGHSADAWDPASVRASTGSVFAVPVVRQDSVREVLSWARSAEHGGAPFTVIGTDEHGDVTLPGAPIEGPVLFVIGSERTGMSAAWREGCDVVASIPMAGSASSLNAAAAGSIVLYEALRRREEAS
ncbi:TrmH family RNA methyltransferase [Brachybacterium sp. AOP25-B2-12]|uniref:TrmH family RNA methyltransferase n=1 Tax=Brachybacterium sp. AOP25-B2-12 TaxID=3457710 RepID=UPI004033AB26